MSAANPSTPPFRPRLVRGAATAPPPATSATRRVNLANAADLLDTLCVRLAEACADVGHAVPGVMVAESAPAPRSPRCGWATETAHGGTIQRLMGPLGVELRPASFITTDGRAHH